MSNMINVDGSDDPAYRYKMPRLMSKVEGKGNGVKTVIVNCSEIADALGRTTAQVCKYFGCEIGAMTNYDEKADKALVNGSFDTKILQEALTGYIKKFVRCPSCGNPETVQELKGKKKKAFILLNCKACGASEEADNTHKLFTFILKELSGDNGGKSKKELRKQRRNEKMKKQKDEDKSNGSLSDEEKEEKRRKKKKKKEKEKDADKDKKKKKKRKKKKEESEKEEDDEVEEVTESLGGLTVHDIAALNSAVDIISDMLRQNTDVKTVIEAVEEQQVKSTLRRADRIPMIIYALLSAGIPPANFVKYFEIVCCIENEVKTVFLTSEEASIDLLVSMEEGVARIEENDKRAVALTYIPLALKAFYDEDLVEEETILKWNKGSLDETKYKHLRCLVSDDILAQIKEHAKRIVDWLQEADSDSSEDED